MSQKPSNRRSPRERINRFFQANKLTIGLFVFLLGYLVYQRYPEYVKDKRFVDRPAPDFILNDLAGNTVQLSKYQGQIVIVNFWATWCLPCRVEIPLLNAIYDELHPRGLVVLGLSNEDRQTIDQYLMRNRIAYPVLLDREGEVARKYELRSYPTLVFVNREGRIEDITHGINFLLKWKIRHMVTGDYF